jgi:hydrogenase/urease accessory protein HupE
MSNASRLAGFLTGFPALVSLVAGLCLLTAAPSLGHEVRPAYVELREQTALGTFDVLFKTPMQGDLRLALGVTFSAGVEPLSPVLSRATDNAMVQTWQVRATDRLAGEQVRVVGLENTVSDALLRVEFADGRSWVQRLTPASPRANVPAAQSSSGVAVAYLGLGIEHILFGFDHLLFVLGLILITANLRQVVKAITAFTAAHSITLASAALGFVHVPPKPVEAAIALSIAFVALEIVHARDGKAGVAARAPWLVAFAFGLLHGFGFAGALSEIGMPAGHIPVALLFFNVGVEAGQLLFVAAVMALAGLVRLIPLAMPRWVPLVPPYLIGSVAMFWVIQRVSVF